jgi:signal transduction histidine kinase
MIILPNIILPEINLPPFDGILFKLPKFCRKNQNRTKCKKYYETLRITEKIEICPYGFNSFVFSCLSSTYIITGFRVEGYFDGKKLKDKLTGEFIPVIPQKEFNNIVYQIKALIVSVNESKLLKQQLKESKEFIDPNIHEIRKLNREIKSQVEHLQLILSEKDQPVNIDFAKFRADNIFATSSLITMRLDSYDFHVNPGILATTAVHSISVYKKFDKIKRCLSSLCLQKRINITLKGTSYSTISGYQIFDLLPFILLENATKYSPEENEISVSFRQINGTEEIEIINIGPHVKTDEISSVFVKKFRGKWAKDYSGTGIGLFFAKQICDIHNISIDAQTSAIAYSKNLVPHSQFKITLRYKPII